MLDDNNDDKGNASERASGPASDPKEKEGPQGSSAETEKHADPELGNASIVVETAGRAKFEEATAAAREVLVNSPKGFFGRFNRGLRGFFGANVKELPEASPHYSYIDLLEVQALVRFATERGVDAKEPAIPALVESLLYINDRDLSAEDHQKLSLDISSNYSRLCEHTYKELGVNGRTIIDSAQRSDQAMGQAGAFFLAFLILALTPDVASILVPNTDPMFAVIETVSMLSPFFWGGVGGSVFLLKTLSEIAGASRFDTRRYEGVGTRVFLGAIVGFTVVQLFDFSDILVLTFQPGTTFEFGNNGLAFIAGLGVKAVYGVFETMVNGLHKWVTGKVK